VLCCLNGPEDGTEALITAFMDRHPNLGIRILHSEVPGLGRARNLGFHQAQFSYFTNVDDDDWISPRYLESLLAHCRENTVVMTYVCNIPEEVDQPTGRFDNYLNIATFPFAGQTVTANDVPVGSADGAKAASTRLALEVLYDVEITSGLDVVFWTELVTRNSLRVHVLSIIDHAIYYRHVRPESMSRSIDEEFLTNRFVVIERLQRLEKLYPRYSTLISNSIGGQIGHLGAVGFEWPDRYQELADHVQQIAIPERTAIFNHKAATTLAICYVYTPYNDASAITAAKRLAEMGEPFDIITHSFGKLRQFDRSTNLIDAHLRGQCITVEGTPSTNSAAGMAHFCHEGAAAWKNLQSDRPPYKKLYSRVQWPFSHALAAFIKVKQPSIYWIAEFSDPLSVDIKGELRPGVLGDFPERKKIEKRVAKQGFDLAGARTANEWLEWVAYALADQIIFTNDNQMSYMISRIPHSELADRVRKISVAIPHPGVPQQILDAVEDLPAINDGRKHIGYFGWFYAKRGVGEILDALTAMPKSERRKVCVHMFIPHHQLNEVRHLIHHQHLDTSVKVHQYVNYMEFVRIARTMDWLLVADSLVTADLGSNPYLPSKYADYSSLGIKIWGLIEPGSPLSHSHLDLSTEAGDCTEALAALRQIIAE
jgi:glycosyltransferase involved in cell wall biosynthesis